MGARKSGASRSGARKRATRRRSGGGERLPVAELARRRGRLLLGAGRRAPFYRLAQHGRRRRCGRSRRRPARQDERRAVRGARRAIPTTGCATERSSRPARRFATSSTRWSFATSAGQHLSLSGAPTFAPNGDFAGYRGVARESGALARLERLLALEGALLRGLAEADDLASALPLVVGRTCELRSFRSRLLLEHRRASRVLHRVASQGDVEAAKRSTLVEGAAAPDWLDRRSRVARGLPERRRATPPGARRSSYRSRPAER